MACTIRIFEPESEDPAVGRLLPLVLAAAQLEEVLPPLPRAEVHPHDVAADDAGVRVVVLEGERLGTLLLIVVQFRGLA